MKNYILILLIMVLFIWVSPGYAQNLHFVSDTSNKSILVYKNLHQDTLIFIKRIIVPQSLLGLHTPSCIVGDLNTTSEDSFLSYETSQKVLKRMLVKNKNYLFVPPRPNRDVKIGGFRFSKENLEFEAFSQVKHISYEENNSFFDLIFFSASFVYFLFVMAIFAMVFKWRVGKLYSLSFLGNLMNSLLVIIIANVVGSILGDSQYFNWYLFVALLPPGILASCVIFLFIMSLRRQKKKI